MPPAQINDDGIEELRLLLEVEWQSDLDCQLTVKPLPASLNKWVWVHWEGGCVP